MEIKYIVILASIAVSVCFIIIPFLREMWNKEKEIRQNRLKEIPSNVSTELGVFRRVQEEDDDWCWEYAIQRPENEIVFHVDGLEGPSSAIIESMKLVIEKFEEVAELFSSALEKQEEREISISRIEFISDKHPEFFDVFGDQGSEWRVTMVAKTDQSEIVLNSIHRDA